MKIPRPLSITQATKGRSGMPDRNTDTLNAPPFMSSAPREPIARLINASARLWSRPAYPPDTRGHALFIGPNAS
jgi:hypothetical protein